MAASLYSSDTLFLIGVFFGRRRPGLAFHFTVLVYGHGGRYIQIGRWYTQAQGGPRIGMGSPRSHYNIGYDGLFPKSFKFLLIPQWSKVNPFESSARIRGLGVPTVAVTL